MTEFCAGERSKRRLDSDVENMGIESTDRLLMCAAGVIMDLGIL